ncbi:MAG: aspartate-semialdehyde dehydrogenase [Legionellales bacterium]|nr:aspartate-semialdehyde dehydrogenase [Legionellales bacterium]
MGASSKVNVAVVGATGVVGETIIQLLDNSSITVDKIFPLSSSRSIGKSIVFNNKNVYIEDLEGFDFSKVELALFAAGSEVSKQYCLKAVEKGCFVIDNSSAYRDDPNIPLIVPEVNAYELDNVKSPILISNPNCSTIQMCVALEPIYRLYGINRVNVSTYQSVSGTGRKAISELVSQTTNLLNGKEGEAVIYDKPIAFNAIPHIDEFLDNGYTKEEMKMFNETRKIFNDQEILVNATAVRIATIFGHSESVNVETKESVDLEALKKEYMKTKGLKFFDDQEYPTAMTDAVGKLDVFVGRLRKDITRENALNLWVVADNVRKGGAWNTVQIAQLLVKKII